ncbi:MAG: ABC transporter ATP-binding protein, partial [bacterium]|nr:ABC transporter ATP-binding protein [bacterium]
KHLAILFQKFELYPFTARESIGYGDIERVNQISEIKESAQKTDMHNFIETLPLKYENPLAVDFENGIDVSIGQWQRMGIARMLFRKKADMLILDEPTSNVDPKAEEEIFQHLTKKAKDKILVFISQRFSTTRLADQIMVIEKGKITEQGNHSKLMKLDGTYAELFNLQAKGYQ